MVIKVTSSTKHKNTAKEIIIYTHRFYYWSLKITSDILTFTLATHLLALARQLRLMKNSIPQSQVIWGTSLK